MPTQLKAIHASRVGKSGLLLRESQNISREPHVLKDTGGRPMFPGGDWDH